MRKIIYFLFIIAMFSSSQVYAFSLFGSSMEDVTAKDGMVSINTKSLKSGESKHYVYKDGNNIIRFFIARDHQGAIKAALDACEVCWHADKGYKLEDGTMVCANCGMKFALNRIGTVRGGCNPHPLAFAVEGDEVSIQASELLDGAKFFPGNKS